MKCATSSFNRGIFRKNLRRFWPLWLAYLVIWLLVLPLPMISNLRGVEYNSASFLRNVGYVVLTNIRNEGLLLTGVGAICAAMAVWGWMYNPRSSAMLGSLPVCRGSLYISGVASALVPMLGAHVLTFLVTLCVELAMGYFAPVYLLQWLALSVMELLLFFGIATFCAMLTGNIVVLPVLYAVLNFTAIVVEAVVQEILRVFVYGLSSLQSVLTPLSPFAQISNVQIYSQLRTVTNELNYVSFQSWGTMIAYGVVGIVLLALASLLLRSRRMESAGDVVAVRALRPVFKYVFTAGCALVLGILFYTLFCGGTVRAGGLRSAAVLTFLMLVGAAIGYFAAAMLLKKSFRVFSQWRGFAVSAVVLILLCAVCEADLFGYERIVPEASEIAYASISSCALQEPENLSTAVRLHESIVENKREYENHDGDSRWFYIYYSMKDGREMSRQYRVPIDREKPIEAQNEPTQLYQALCNTREVIFKNMPIVEVTEDHVAYGNISWAPVSWETDEPYEERKLTAAEAVELWEQGLLPDYEEGNLGTVSLVEPNKRDTSCHIYIELYDPFLKPNHVTEHTSGMPTATATPYIPKEGGGTSDSISVVVTLDAENTLKWLSEHGIVPLTQAEVDARAKFAASASDIENDWTYSSDVNYGG